MLSLETSVRPVRAVRTVTLLKMATSVTNAKCGCLSGLQSSVEKCGVWTRTEKKFIGGRPEWPSVRRTPGDPGRGLVTSFTMYNC